MEDGLGSGLKRNARIVTSAGWDRYEGHVIQPPEMPACVGMTEAINRMSDRNGQRS
jgi:hypothetical protein